MTRDRWHMTHDMWQVMNIVKKKFLALMVCDLRWFEDFEEKVFVEQPRLHWVC